MFVSLSVGGPAPSKSPSNLIVEISFDYYGKNCIAIEYLYLQKETDEPPPHGGCSAFSRESSLVVLYNINFNVHIVVVCRFLLLPIRAPHPQSRLSPWVHYPLEPRNRAWSNDDDDDQYSYL